MKIGDTVYTVNAKTGHVDAWTFYGYIKDRAVLGRDGDTLTLPRRFIFDSYEAALLVAAKPTSRS